MEEEEEEEEVLSGSGGGRKGRWVGVGGEECKCEEK